MEQAKPCQSSWVTSQSAIRALNCLTLLASYQFYLRNNIDISFRVNTWFKQLDSSQEMLIKMKCSDYRQTNRADIKKNLKGLSELLPKETSSVLMKLTFLVLVKSSNALYIPKKATEVSGLYIHRTRYSAPAMNAIFQSQFLPVISSQDKPLLKRLFEHSHIKSTNG